MATNLSKFVGQATWAIGATGITVSGVGFQPKVVIFFSSSSVTAGASSSSTKGSLCIGFSDGVNYGDSALGGNGGLSTSTAGHQSGQAAFIEILGNSPDSHATTVSMSSDGFTATFDVAAVDGGVVDFIALGGSDLANVAIGTMIVGTGGGNIVTSGLGFQPNFVMLVSAGHNFAGTGESGVDANLSYGCALSSTKRFAIAVAVADGATMSNGVNGVSIHRSDACLVGLTNGAAVSFVADFVSMDAGGFTINVTTAPATQIKAFYLAIGGSNLNWDIATAARPTTATTQSRTGLTFQPEVAWWANADLTTLNNITSNAVSLLGASDGTHTQSLYASHNDAINTVAGTKEAAVAAQDGAPANSSVTASFTSFNSDGWTITWGGTGAANQISSVSLAGTTVAGATCSHNLSLLGAGCS